ncbi:MAG: hypothetical protein ACKVKN_08855 [Pseudomonadales bacterium]
MRFLRSRSAVPATQGPDTSDASAARSALFEDGLDPSAFEGEGGEASITGGLDQKLKHLFGQD